MSDDLSPPAPRARRFPIWALVPIAIAALAAWRWVDAAGEEADTRRTRGAAGVPVPVELSPIERGALDRVRELPGTLEPSARVVIAAEVEGVVERVHVDLADVVGPGEVLLELDPRERRQAEVAARAVLAVARARAASAVSAAEAAERTLGRFEALAEREIESASALDEARAAASAARANEAVSAANVAQARAAHGTARLQLSRTRITGRWDPAAGPRRVASRVVDEGARVSVGDPLLTVVDTDPLVVVVMVSAVEHARLRVGQEVRLRSDGVAPFAGTVARVAPAFDPDSRQARVEIEVANPDGALLPGRFVRASIVLERVEASAIVPQSAIVRRGGRDVVFVVDREAGVAREVAVRVGLSANGRVEVEGEGLAGEVVSLGQQRLTDGAAVRPSESAAPAAPSESEPR